MSFLDEVRADRQQLADVLRKHSGMRRLVEELYPDRAHFIYELLQNAEDRRATEATFVLRPDRLSFMHDGEPFTEQHVWGITDIGLSTKRDQDDQIGRFGVGFKAVFAYSETPHVWSPTFCFKISNLVLPAELPGDSNLGDKTRFEFPFNNQKKSARDAYAEVEAGLRDLAETTLLFLSHLNVIRWEIGLDQRGEVARVQHSGNHVEIRRRMNGNGASSSHFLRFSTPVRGLERQNASIAFAMDYVAGVKTFDSQQPIAKQLRMVPATPGCVAVFFPADKENSGLRFHLHAPFVPELSRASIKDTPANEPLFIQLAVLTGESLRCIRDLKLLTADFLSILPNPQDPIPPRYQPIRTAIISKMNNEALTPTFHKTYAAAKTLVQAKASLKELLTQQDLSQLGVNCQLGVPMVQWAIGATQKNSNIDRFLTGLAINAWDFDKFVEQLELRASQTQRIVASASRMTNGLDQQFMNWLASKPPSWHQRLYAVLYRELPPEAVVRRLGRLKIVRISDGTYNTGEKSYFPSEGIEHDKLFPRVDHQILAPGNAKSDAQDAEALLAALGVRQVGEVEQVHAILTQRYANPFQPRLSDVERFIEAMALDKTFVKLLADYPIIKGVDGKWRKPDQAYVDSPVIDTGLSHFFESPEVQKKRVAVATTYAELGLSVETLRRFFDAVGVRIQLEITPTKCPGNPEWRYLSSAPGERLTSPIDRDYTILSLERCLTRPSLPLSRLVWRTMCELRRDFLKACYQKNNAGGPHFAASQLIHILRKAAWIPQNDRFVRPADAERALLPEGFPFDVGAEWIKGLQFGGDSQQRLEGVKKRESEARELGFSDLSALERAKEFTQLPQTEQERILTEFRNRQFSELPQHEPRNPERRAQQIGREATAAPERTTEQRLRSISLYREEVKQEAAEYLRQQYTNTNGEMICQICKAPLPFRLDDGTYYCEKVEFLEELKRRHPQNYLSLCPNHGAMFREVNGSREVLRTNFEKMHGPELIISLAKKSKSIYFTATHVADLKKIFEVDREES